MLVNLEALLPESHLIAVYYRYSDVVLVACLLLTPFLCYVILTQSASLGNFKWLLLNHTMWSFVMQLLVNAGKPVILVPHTACYWAGYLRFVGDFRLSALFTMALFCSVLNSAASVSLTLTNRYLTVFPGFLRNLVRSRFHYACILLTFAVLHLLLLLMLLPVFALEQEGLFELAHCADPVLALFFHEQSFVFFQSAVTDTLIVCSAVVLVALTAVGLFAVVFFRYKTAGLRRLGANASVCKLQRSLQLCSLIQVLNAVCFLALPVAGLLGFIWFRQGTLAGVMVVLLMVLGTSELVEIITLFYFVTPYRKFMHSLLKIASCGQVENEEEK